MTHRKKSQAVGNVALRPKTRLRWGRRKEGQNLFIAQRRRGAKKSKTMNALRMRAKTTK